MGLAGAVVGMGFLVFLFAIGIFFTVIAMLFLIYQIPKVGKYLSFSLAIAMCYILYTSFLPNKQFYIDEFKKRTNIILPDPYFMKKEKSCPTLLGGCNYTAIILLNKEKYESLRAKINFKKLDSCTTPKIVIKQAYIIPTPLECWKMETNSNEFLELIVFPDTRLYYQIYFTFR